MMSVMSERKAYTVRDMNRNTAKVLEACREYGSATIRSRNGDEYRITPVQKQDSPQPRSSFVERMRAHQKQLQEMGAAGPATEEGMERLNQIIAGEE